MELKVRVKQTEVYFCEDVCGYYTVSPDELVKHISNDHNVTPNWEKSVLDNQGILGDETVVLYKKRFF